MENKIENEAMNYQRKFNFRAGKIAFLLVLIFFMMAIGGTASAKSLYVLSDKNAYPQPLKAYDIGPKGTLTFQAQYTIPRYNLGSVGLAIDSDSGYLFVTYEWWNYIILINSKTMTAVQEMVEAPGSWNLNGIVYNNKKHRLYCVDSGRPLVWEYDWNAQTQSLTLVNGAPFLLRNASAYGIALDEAKQLLYVANSTNRIYAYDTSDWSLKRTIILNHTAVCVAVDSINNYLYTGGGSVGNAYLTQYNLISSTQLDTLVEPQAEAGVIGVAVDPNTSKVYITTGNEGYQPGGDNIRIYDKYLSPVGSVSKIGNPTGLAIPSNEVGYNPLGLKKTIVGVVNSDGVTQSDSINAGDLITYRISFSNNENTNTVTNVSLADMLPNELTFVSASEDGVFGHYDVSTNTYTWTYPSLLKGTYASLDLTAKVKAEVLPKTAITNLVTIKSDTTPPVTARAEIITASKPLNIKKTVFGATEGITKWVDANEVLTYNIYLDNNDNNFAATDVIVTDTLPDDLVYVKAGPDDIFGSYDENSHSFIWSIPSLASKASVVLGMTVRLKDTVPDGTTITNTVTAQSNETTESASSVDIRVGQGPLMAQSVQVMPSTIRRDSKISSIRVIVEMPEGYKVNDIKNTPLLLSLIDDPQGVTIPANSGQFVTQALGKIYIVAMFDTKRIINAIDGYGPKDILIEGTLTNGGLFAAYATINITKFAGY